MAASLALCIIVRDEAERLERALASASGGFDELVVLDSGSVDGSRDVARIWGAKLLVWPRAAVFDFASARNMTISCAHTDYWWWMDADEVAAEGTVEQLRSQAGARPRHAVAGVTRDRGTRWLRPRLAPRDAEHRWFGACHEWLHVPHGSVSEERIVFDHLPRPERGSSSLVRNLRILGAEIEAGRGSQREYFYVALTLQSLGRPEAAARVWECFLGFRSIPPISLSFARLYLARAYAALGHARAAAEQAILALDTQSRFAEAACLLGDIARSLGERLLAAGWYSRALSWAPCPLGPLFHEPDCYGPYPQSQLAALSVP